LRFLLPSLLASNNLPLLSAADPHKLLIGTTMENWNILADLPIMDRSRRHVVTASRSLLHKLGRVARRQFCMQISR
jgi:hypothetical protein